MIHAVIVSLPTGAASKVYRIISSSGRDVLKLERELPATVKKFLTDNAATACTLRVPHLTTPGDIAHTYYVMYTRDLQRRT